MISNIIKDSILFPIFKNPFDVDAAEGTGDYGVLGKNPKFVADFINEKYFTDATLQDDFASAITHSRSGNATMTDGYGDELVTNGSYSDGTTGWTANEGFAVNNGVATVTTTSGSAAAYIQQSFSTVNGKTYILTYNLISREPAFKVSIDDDSFSNSGDVISANYNDLGRNSIVFTATSSTAYLRFISNTTTANKSVSFDNVSVREMPVLKWAPHNLLAYSEQFDDASWNKNNVTVAANATTAPDGSITADKITPNTSVTSHRVTKVETSNVAKTLSVYAKPAGYSWIILQTPAGYAWFDVENGVVGTETAVVSGTIEQANNGFYKCTLTSESIANGTFYIWAVTQNNQTNFAGDGTSGVYLWGAHLHRSDLGGMVDNPDRGDSYVPTAGRPVGANLVANGTFDTDSDWTKGTGWTISGGKANHAAGTASQLTSTNSSLLNGEVYEVRFTVSNRTAGSLLLEGAIWTSAETISANGDYVFYKVKSGDGPAIFYGSGTFDGSIDDITVRKSTVNPAIAAYLPRIGHHVYNGSAWVNEGLLAESEARVNVIEDSQVLDSGFWTATGLTSRTADAVGPDGVEDSAYTLLADTATSLHSNSNIVSVTSGTTYTGSVYVKKGTQRYISLAAGNTATWAASIKFDLTDGVVASVISGSGAIQDVGNGWFRCSITGAAGATAVTGFYTYLLDDSLNASFTGTGTETVITYGAQVEAGSTPSSLVPTSGSSVTRASEAFTIPSANLPWPSPNYIGSELVTNGTFDTDVSGWSTRDTGVISYDSGALKLERTGAGTVAGVALAYQTVSGLTVGNVYEASATILFDSADSTASAAYAELAIDQSGNNASTSSTRGVLGFDVAETISLIFVATATSQEIGLSFRGNGTGFVNYDNVSVREINPLSVSIAMDGRVTYADDDTYSTVILHRWYQDGSNYLIHRIDTALTQTGHQVAHHRVNGVDDYSTGNPQNTMFSPDVLVPFDVAVRHGTTFVQVASDGLTPAANTTPTALPDLSANDLNLAYDYMGTVGTFRVWDRDLGDTGIVEATNPSLEPSLSLTFEGTSTNSFVVNDWSE